MTTYDGFRYRSPRLSEYRHDFNALDLPWIPVVFTNGVSSNVSLIELIDQREDIYWFSGNAPTDVICLMRFLSHLMYVSGYRNSDDKDGIFEAVKNHLESHREKFGIDRFLQVEGVEFKDKSTFPIAHIGMYNRFGTNGNAFRDRHLLNSDYAINLFLEILSTTLFKSGKCSNASVAGKSLPSYVTIVKWYANATVGYAIGKNIGVTLLMNLVDIDDDQATIPFWDISLSENSFLETVNSDGKAIYRFNDENLRRYVSSYVGRLVPYRIAIKIDIDRGLCWIGALNYPEANEEPDPHTVCYMGKNKLNQYRSNDSEFISEQTLFDISLMMSEGAGNSQVSCKLSEYIGDSDISFWFGQLLFKDGMQTNIASVASGSTYCRVSIRDRSHLFGQMKRHYDEVSRELYRLAESLKKTLKSCDIHPMIKKQKAMFNKRTLFYRSLSIRKVASGSVSEGDKFMEQFKETISRMADEYYEDMWNGREMKTSHMHAAKHPNFSRGN